MKFHTISVFPLAFVVSCLGASGCFNPDVSSVNILCSAESPQCPEGRVCDGARCVIPGTGSDADMQAADMRVSDSAASPDLLGATCTDVTRIPSKRALLCPSKLVTFTASSVCAQLGMVVCAAASQLDLAKAQSVAGFFVTAQPGDSLTSTCGGAPSSDRITFFGVGRITGLPGVEQSSFQCSGFSVRTTSNTTTWSCSNSTSVDSCFNFDSRQGVACCQP